MQFTIFVLALITASAIAAPLKNTDGLVARSVPAGGAGWGGDDFKRSVPAGGAGWGGDDFKRSVPAGSAGWGGDDFKRSMPDDVKT
ncbi:hypothetical protein AYL99_03768 [Fonsecaea erecta]|uniref:Uncharacterized protein n=1 Tax=Fonsecaea erecta TaxID=1367422 RepID=A0A178ZRE4_9EURO|nr:hypothetical protein AYL99_03768 [Fonsecaea erecta]OAP61565.1 hypothetical protein AYL99_03768 [Fonsecaea erecta]